MKKRKSFFWAIVVLLLTLGVYYVNYTNRYNSTYDEILVLNSKLDSLNLSTQKLLNNRDSLTFRIKILTDSITVQGFVIDSLKAKKNETLSNISTFSNTDITEFFTNRYGYNLYSTSELCSERSN